MYKLFPHIILQNEIICSKPIKTKEANQMIDLFNVIYRQTIVPELPVPLPEAPAEESQEYVPLGC